MTANAYAENAQMPYRTEWKNPSFLLYKPGQVAYADRDVPAISGPHDVIVAVKYTGICGSDVHYWTHGRIGSYVLSSPMVLGHESSAIVHETGSSVTSLAPGDRVAIEPGIPCRRCVACKRGQYNLCPEVSFAATPPIDGTLARFYRVPSDFCHKLPSGVSLEEGALIEPLSVAVHIMRLVDLRAGQSVVIFGCGPVGLLCCAVAKAFSAGAVIGVDVNEERVRFAETYAGVKGFTPGKGQGPEEIAERLINDYALSSGGGADVAVDATGVEVCIQTAVHVLRRGGSYCQGGMGKSEVTFPIMAMCQKELTMKGCFRYGPDDWALAIHLVESGKLSVKELISKKVKFEHAEEAFGDTKAAKGIKILIQGPEG